MMAQDRTALAAYHGELARAFARRRCACGAAAHVVVIGDAPVREMNIVLRHGKPDRDLCLRCAGLIAETPMRVIDCP